MQAMEAASRPNGEHTAAAASADAPDVAVLLDENNALRQQNAALGEQLAAVQHQLAVFKKLLFGPKSERRPFDVAEQQELFEREKSEAGSAAAEDDGSRARAGAREEGLPRRLRERRGVALRRVGAGEEHHSRARRDRGTVSRGLRGHRHRGALQARPEGGELRGAALRAAGDQAPRERGDPAPRAPSRRCSTGAWRT